MYEILMNILIFCIILLIIAFIVGTVQLVIMLIDVRKTTKTVSKKVEAVTSMIDIVSLIFGGMDEAKKRVQNKIVPNKSNLIAFVAGIKKGLQVLLNKKEEKENG